MPRDVELECLIELALEDLAAERRRDYAPRCSADDLSIGVYRVLENLVLHGVRVGMEREREQLTGSRVSGVVPVVAGLWPTDEVTPIRNVDEHGELRKFD